MGDRFPAEIHIGGPVPRAVLGQLIETLAQTGASLIGYGEPTASIASLVDEVAEGSHLSLYHDQALCGQFSELELFLVEHGIHFDVHADAFGEHEARLVRYRGTGEPLTLPSNQAGDLLVPAAEIARLLEEDSLDSYSKLRAIRKIAIPPEMAELTGIRLVPQEEGPAPSASDSEEGLVPLVIVTVNCGSADAILKPRGVALTVLDYDVEAKECPTRDADGTPCQIAQWPAAQLVLGAPDWPMAQTAMRDISALASRRWRCPDCGRVIDHSYEALVDVGSPICGDCDVDMEML